MDEMTDLCSKSIILADARWVVGNYTGRGPASVQISGLREANPWLVPA